VNKEELRKPRLLKPIEDFSIFTGSAHVELMRDKLEEHKLLIYEDNDLMVAKMADKISTNKEGNQMIDNIKDDYTRYTVFDKKNGLPNYGLLCGLEKPNNIISTFTNSYDFVYEPSLMDKPIVTSTHVRMSPAMGYKYTYRTDFDLDPDNNPLAFYLGYNIDKEISNESRFDSSSKEVSGEIRDQLATIPGEAHLIFSRFAVTNYQP
jgi:hypothetical protein